MRDLYSHSLLKLLSGHGNHCGQRRRLTQVALQFRPLEFPPNSRNTFSPVSCRPVPLPRRKARVIHTAPREILVLAQHGPIQTQLGFDTWNIAGTPAL